jgi:lipoate-protein ligase A
MSEAALSKPGLSIQPYDLPDAGLLEPSAGRGRSLIFVPPRILVVIGKGSAEQMELNAENILADDVPVVRRATGGCAVVLTPDMLAVSLAVYGEKQDKSSVYFAQFSDLLITALQHQQISGLTMAGISDIALDGRKIVGSSIYRNRQLVFYHAILNVAGDTSLMERYLAHPPRMPDYRRERRHRDFVTSLRAEGFAFDRNQFESEMKTSFQSLLDGR